MSAGRAAALVLLLLVWSAHALALRPAARRVPASPWAAAELVAPGLFACGDERLVAPFDASAPPAGHALAWAALAPAEDPAGRTWPSPYLGWAPLWLALAGLLGGSASRLPLAPLGLLVLGAAGAGLVQHPAPLILAVGLLAARGLAGARPDAGAEALPWLVAAAACVLSTALVAGAALRAGFATDAQALEPLLSRLGASGLQPASQALEAAHLRAVLDRAAVTAFLAMTALLLHLKSRAAWSAALLLVVTAADLASAHL